MNFAKILIAFAISTLDRLVVKKINYPPVQQLANNTVVRLRAIGNIVTDNDPDNAAQLKTWFSLNKKSLTADAIDTTRAVVLEEMKEGPARDLIIELLDQLKQELGSAALTA